MRLGGIRVQKYGRQMFSKNIYVDRCATRSDCVRPRFATPEPRVLGLTARRGMREGMLNVIIITGGGAQTYHMQTSGGG